MFLAGILLPLDCQPAAETSTLDGCAASHRAVREMKVEGLLPADTKVRSSKYLDNLIEQDPLSAPEPNPARSNPAAHFSIPTSPPLSYDVPLESGDQ
jgi:hypothetical protein